MTQRKRKKGKRKKLKMDYSSLFRGNFSRWRSPQRRQGHGLNVYTKIIEEAGVRYEVVFRATGQRAHTEIKRRKLPSRADVLADRKKVVGDV